MSKLDKVDANLSASDAALEKVVKAVSREDIDQVMSSEIPFESKRSQLSGLIMLLDGSDRDDLLTFAQSALTEVEAHMRDSIIPQITS